MQRGAVDPTHLQVRVGPGALGVQRATVRVIAASTAVNFK